jgi:hypothetical protein
MLINLSGFAGDTSMSFTSIEDGWKSGLVFGNLDLRNFYGNLTIDQHAMVTNFYTTNTATQILAASYSGSLDADYMSFSTASSVIPQIRVNMAHTGTADMGYLRFIFNGYEATSSNFSSMDGAYNNMSDLWGALKNALATTSSNIYFAYGALDVDDDGNADIGLLAVDGDHKGITELIYFEGLGHETLTHFSTYILNPVI